MFRSLFRSNSFLSASLEADEMEEDSMASFKCASDVDCDQWMNFKIKHYNTFRWIREWGTPTAPWGNREGGAATPPARRRRKNFFDLKWKQFHIVDYFRNPNWPQYGIVFREIPTDHNMELFSKTIPYCGLLTKSSILKIKSLNRKISILYFLKILKFLRIYQQYQKSLWPISQRCRLRHFPEVSTQNSSRCSIHGRTHGRTDERNSVRK